MHGIGKDFGMKEEESYFMEDAHSLLHTYKILDVRSWNSGGSSSAILFLFRSV